MVHFLTDSQDRNGVYHPARHTGWAVPVGAGGSIAGDQVGGGREARAHPGGSLYSDVGDAQPIVVMTCLAPHMTQAESSQFAVDASPSMTLDSVSLPPREVEAPLHFYGLVSSTSNPLICPPASAHFPGIDIKVSVERLAARWLSLNTERPGKHAWRARPNSEVVFVSYTSPTRHLDPAVSRSLRSQQRIIKSLPDDWDGYGAPPLPPILVDQFIDDLRRLLVDYSGPLLEIVPGGDGSLQAEIRQNGMEVLYGVFADGEHEFLFRLDGDEIKSIRGPAAEAAFSETLSAYFRGGNDWSPKSTRSAA